MYRLSIIASLLLVIAFSKPLNPKQVIWAVDAGADQPFRSAVGFQYKPVRSFAPFENVMGFLINRILVFRKTQGLPITIIMTKSEK